MTTRSPSSLPEVAAVSVATGLVTALLPPARLSSRLRRSMHAALGLGSGAAVLLALSGPDGGAPSEARGDRHPEDAAGARTAREPLPLPTRLGVASAFGGLMALSSVGGVVLDAKAERALARRGAKNPRLWLGAAAGALTAATSLLERRLDSLPGLHHGSDRP